MRVSSRLLSAAKPRGLDEFIRTSLESAQKNRIGSSSTSIAQFHELGRHTLDRHFSDTSDSVSTSLDSSSVGARWFANAECGISPKHDVVYNPDTATLLRRVHRYTPQGSKVLSGFVTGVGRISSSKSSSSSSHRPFYIATTADDEELAEAHERLLSHSVGSLNIAVPKRARTVQPLIATRLTRDVAHSISHAPTVYVCDGMLGGGTPSDRAVSGVRVVAAADNAVSALALRQLLHRTPSSMSASVDGPVFASAGTAGSTKHTGGQSVQLLVGGGYQLEDDAHAKEFGGPLAGRHLELGSPHFTLHNFVEGEGGVFDVKAVIAATTSLKELASALAHSAAVSLASSGRGVVVPGVLIGGPDKKCSLHLTKSGPVPAAAASSPYFLGGPFVVISKAGVAPLFAGSIVGGRAVEMPGNYTSNAGARTKYSNSVTDALKGFEDFADGVVFGGDGVAVVGVRRPRYAPRCVAHDDVTIQGDDFSTLIDAASSVGYASSDEIEAVLESIYGTKTPKAAGRGATTKLDKTLKQLPAAEEAKLPSVKAVGKGGAGGKKARGRSAV